MIYFIQMGDDGPIKIGKAVFPERRLTALRTASPYDLHLLAVMDGDRKEEKELHAQFAEHRMRGEWFKPAQELLELIARVGTPPGNARVQGAGSIVECRMCGLAYTRNLATDNDAHRRRHDEIRNVSLPHPFVEYLKDWGAYIQRHGKLGSFGNSEYSHEEGKRIQAFALWVDSSARLENPDDFEQFMADQLDEMDKCNHRTAALELHSEFARLNFKEKDQ